MKISWKWYDGWIGYFWDRHNRVLYVCPLPWVVLRIGTGTASKPCCHSKDHLMVVKTQLAILEMAVKECGVSEQVQAKRTEVARREIAKGMAKREEPTQ